MFCVCNTICYGVQYECFVCAMQYVMVWKWMLVSTMWYALVWKWMFVCIMKYALVCIMIVCMYHASFLYWHELAETMYPDFVTCSNCLNCYWKWALALTLYNTIARKCYTCIWHLVYSIPRSLPLSLVNPRSRPLISWHTRANQLALTQNCLHLTYWAFNCVVMVEWTTFVVEYVFTDLPNSVSFVRAIY